jgi:hypothetical protein
MPSRSAGVIDRIITLPTAVPLQFLPGSPWREPLGLPLWARGGHIAVYDRRVSTRDERRSLLRSLALHVLEHRRVDLLGSGRKRVPKHLAGQLQVPLRTGEMYGTVRPAFVGRCWSTSPGRWRPRLAPLVVRQ